jgi:rifampicin phosphotransferase
MTHTQRSRKENRGVPGPRCLVSVPLMSYTFTHRNRHSLSTPLHGTMSDLLPFDRIQPTDVALVGGKGLSLARLTAAGLPVPPGFVLSTTAFRRLRGRRLSEDAALLQQLDTLHRELGEGPVAVRSSATAEDGQEASFAGQQETILGVVGTDALHSAIERCWASLDGERAVQYRRRQGIDEAALAMAAVVQRLVSSEVSGVLFTRDPLDPTGKRMLIEASWGLGESVVSGRVTPDRFHVDRETGRCLERHIAVKKVQITPTGEVEVPEERRAQPCLDDVGLEKLAELGRRVEGLYGEPRDIEWGYAEGRFWLLQARPITTAGADERDKVRTEEIAYLRSRAEPTGTVWGRFNLAEVLPEPTPMSWSIASHFMAGKGGYGLMFRDLGFDPDPMLDNEGVFDLVCGRPYCNLSREARMHYRRLPFEYPFAALKANPSAAFYPTPGINHARLPWHFWLLLPIQLPRLMFQLMKGATVRAEAGRTFADRYCQYIAVEFRKEAEAAQIEDLSTLSASELLQRIRAWTWRTVVDFARDSLKPSALAQESLRKVEMLLVPPLGASRAPAAARELMVGAHPEPDSDLGGAVRDLSAGTLSETAFLERFGHRCGQEMELSRPRWSESPEALRRSIRGTHHGTIGNATSTLEKIADEAKLTGPARAALEAEVRTLHTYVGLRETAKNDLMRGYAVIRRLLLSLDQKYNLQGGIFFLTLEELPRLVEKEDLSGVIAARKKRRAIALSLPAPPILFSDDLDAIGRAPSTDVGSDALKGSPLSAGVAEGPALVLEAPPEGETGLEGYILVCPSTDPDWVPLFVHARGLVMESGGVLSHGAIVAREFGLPAVAGLPGITSRLRTGQRVRVDGGQGTVTVLPG